MSPRLFSLVPRRPPGLKFSVIGGKKEETETELGELAEAITGEVPREAEVGLGPNGGSYDEVRERIEDIQARIEQFESSSAALRSELGQFHERLDGIEGNVRELLSLYELATRNQNPFFQSDGSESSPSPPLPEENRQVAIPKDEPLSVRLDDGSGVVGSDAPKRMMSRSPGLGLPKDKELSEKIVDELTLEDLDNSPTTSMLILRWMEYIIHKVGHTGLSSTLDYYVQIGWMSRAAAAKVLSFSAGIGLQDFDANPPQRSALAVTEHLVSLYFVTKLKGDKVFDNVYLGIKDEVERLGLSLSSEGV